MRSLLREPGLDPAFKDLALTLPSEIYVAEQVSDVDPQRLHAVREAMLDQLATALQADWAWAWDEHQVQGGYRPDAEQSGRRALANKALAMLVRAAALSGEPVWPGKAYQRFKDATNMTDRLGALEALVGAHHELARPALERFYALFRHEPLVLDKWFMLQARAPEKNGQVFAQVKALLKHPDFTLGNPNRARALLFVLAASNPAAFHRTDAAGYVLWADKVIEMDAINPQLASRFARSLDRWRNLAEPYRSAAREAIARVAAKAELSSDTREIIERALQD
jgi:aminopeptidase N